MIHIDKNDLEVIDMVTTALEWYSSCHSTASILQLLAFQDRLSILSCNVAKIVADRKASYLAAYFQRKHSYSIKKLYHIGRGKNIGTSQELAELEIEEEKNNEIQQERASYTISLQLKQLNKVLSAAQQRISFLKQEQKRMEALTHDNKNG